MQLFQFFLELSKMSNFCSLNIEIYLNFSKYFQDLLAYLNMTEIAP